MQTNLIRKFEAWPELYKPPFTQIEIIGCCEYHEKLGDFEWYRKHTWQDFRDLMLGTVDFMQILDPFSFSSMDLRVHRYFMKGALSALTQITSKANFFEDIEYTFWQWISADKKALENLQLWKGENSEFSKEEVADIVELVELIHQLKFNFYEHDKNTIKDINNTLVYWKEYKTLAIKYNL